MLRFALVGNPNSGKTTLFNALTGSTAHVGNWPGVTVDKKEGVCKSGVEPVEIVDLPGIYSLSPYTAEEVVARNFILDERPDCIINIVDATNLERNLYLTTQLLEVDLPIVVALNMTDVLKKNGDDVDEKTLEKRIGVPVVEISALKEMNIDELVNRAIEASKGGRVATSVLKGNPLWHAMHDAEIALKLKGVSSPLFHAVKLVENDELEVQSHPDEAKAVREYVTEHASHCVDTEAEIADARYKHITSYFSPTLHRSRTYKKDALTTSDKVDRVLTHKWAGIPIFLVILFTVFHLTFAEDFLFLGSFGFLPTLEEVGLMVEVDGELVPKNFGVALLACIYDGAIFSPGVILFNLMGLLTGTLFGLITDGIVSLGAAEWAVSLIGDGVLGGIGGVLSFVPQILLLLLILSILEDTGYMARVAFILDKLFRRFGVSGRAFIPMVMGFGCSVPAIVNTRTLADEREKTLTLRTIPFFSCGAKLPILVGVAGAAGHMLGLGDGSWISYAMYVLGMALAVVSILVMRSTTQRGEVAPFIMELPSYRMPSGKALMYHMWDKAKHYLKKVFTIILASTIIIWFLSNYGWNWKPADIQNSILASLGQLLQPIFTPLGFGSQLNEYGWVFVVAAVTGLIAKEEVISTFGALAALFSAVAAPELAAEGAVDVWVLAQATGITGAALIAFIVFNMTTIPCFAAVAAAKGETPKGKFRWTILFWVFTSYLTTAVVYTVLTWWWTAIFWAAVFAVATTVLVLYNKKRGKAV